MKEGYLLKRKTEHGVVSPQELEKINQYTRREFQAQELYAFSVVLCDNQVDRDFECFTKAALEKLKELFLGKTGIFDHSMRSGGQTARILSGVLPSMDAASLPTAKSWPVRVLTATTDGSLRQMPFSFV